MAENNSAEKTVNNGNTAVVNYTGRLEDGQVFDTSVGKEPFRFTIGAKQVIPAFANGKKFFLSTRNANIY